MTVLRFRTRTLAALVVFLVLSAVLVAFPGERASAVTGAGFDPGYLISDQRFLDKNAMSEQQIQSFLDTKIGGRCVAGYTCINSFTESTFSRATVEAGHCTAYSGAVNERASRIIYKVAQSCGISPQTLLVLLEKETSLVTGTKPTSGTYRKATGYGCPDTSDCDAAFYGFYNQVYKAAWQFRQYTNYPNRYFKIGNVAVGYHPNSSCGSSTVTIKNQASANLYNYTPYQPNTAALGNMYGTGDACSSYGNRNFWRIFIDWFGTGETQPFGNVEQVSGVNGGVQISGWAIDPDSVAPIDVHLYVDGNSVAVKADLSRPDVAGGYPLYGDKHGYSYKFAAAPGRHNVCVWGINTGPGSNVMFGCKTVDVPVGTPFGAIEGISAAAGQITVSGWAIDPDSVLPIQVQLQSGTKVVTIAANRERADIAKAYPGYGTAHGFSTTFDSAAGKQTVCAIGVNVGAGSNGALACRDVVVPSAATDAGRLPIGNLEFVGAAVDGISVSGWTLDPDSVDPISIHVYVDSASKSYLADKDRPDVGAGYPGYGSKHGFGEKIAAAPGAHNVCVYGINNAAGGNVLLGCKTVTVPQPVLTDQGRAPVGNFEFVGAAADGISVSGWALDKDTVDSISLHVYVDSASKAYLADKDRADVAAVYPGYGTKHGFSEKIAAAPGSHRVCVYGINNGAGGNALLGCKTVTVPQPVLTDQGRAPVGNFEFVGAAADGISVSGWALDKDTVDSISLHVYVDSASKAYLADKDRADVAAVYPGYGTKHGFSEKIAAAPGSHRVCVYGINNGAGGNSLLGCKTVTVP